MKTHALAASLILATLPSPFLLAPLSAAVSAAVFQQSGGGDQEPKLLILHVNDFHGQLLPLRYPRPRGGVLGLAREVQQQRQRAAALGARFLFTDAGDWFQGTPEGNSSKGRLVVDLQDLLAVDLATLGNHEFDFGADNARALVARAQHPVITANVWRKDGRRPVWLRPYQLLAIGGLRVAFIGLVTRRTAEQSTGPFGQLVFEDEMVCLERELARVRDLADDVILITHCGYGRDREIAKRFPEIRLILGGHSHTSLKRPAHVGSTWIVQTGGKASEYYIIEARVDRVARRLEILSAKNRRIEVGTRSELPALADWIARQTSSLRAQWDRPVGELAAALGGSRGVGASTTAGNLLADLIRQAGKAQIGVMNRGGIRSHLAKGPVTRRQVFELLPFQNDVVSMDLLGAEIRAVLEEALASAGRPFEVSGLRYSLVKTAGKQAAPAVWKIAKIEVEDGSPLDPEASYRVATNSFLAGGGDGAASFKKGRQRQRHKKLLRELLLEALQRQRPLRPAHEARIRILR